jgi:uncharacterized protein YbgA (DUF1722 family)/uncharacterized protein YbbK (DUF523 family)
VEKAGECPRGLRRRIYLKINGKISGQSNQRQESERLDMQPQEVCAFIEDDLGKIKVGVSRCLLGDSVRYDGGHKRDRYLTDVLAKYFDWVPVCPEVEVGMGIPRESIRLVGDLTQPHLVGNKSGQDWTERMRAYAKIRLDKLAQEDLSGFIFKSDSPSSGAFRVKVYNVQGQPAGTGSGAFAGAFMRRFPLVPVEEEGRLHDLGLRENFIERVFSYARLQGLAKNISSRAVVEFHTRQKLLIMSHSTKHYQMLGKLVAEVKKQKPQEFMRTYTALFLEALALKATPAKHTNVLQHILGFLKNELTSEKKQDILRVIEDFRKELVPLVVPLTLLQHYARTLQVQYLCHQYYLYPHPKELMLRNHA